ncbi:MAG: hypothetical protein OEZ48_15170 [Candidatus Bathyarchaeota archaeon]|nr:hypothetical protein [Candidatus Bathyarchaeota archaeon]
MTEEDIFIPEYNYDWLSVPNGFEFGIAETDDEIDELIQFRNSWWTRWSDVQALH